MIVVVASLGAYVIYRHLSGNIKVVSVGGLTHRSVYGAQNILLLGSQTRKGQGKGFGSNPSLNTSNSEPAPQTGTAGPVTLVLGSDFAGVKPPPAPSGGKPGHGKRHNAADSGGGGYGSATFVQSRNAGASICSGLPAAVNSGSPP